MDNNLFANRVVMWIADQAPSDKIFSNHEDCETVEIVPATRLAGALEVLRTRSLDAILVSLPFAGCNAEELLGAIRELRSELPVVAARAQHATQKRRRVSNAWAFLATSPMRCRPTT